MEYSESIKKEALAVIKYLYKNMPTYNQIKGTYLGIQYILNMLGLCSSITEIWSDRTEEALKNFANEAPLIRADEINDLRSKIEEMGNAKVKNYFLTSRFDVDFVNVEGQTFSDFNKQSATVIQVINQIKPVTRVLRKLYYIIRIITELSVQNISLNRRNEIPIKVYEYTWDLTNGYFSSKNKFDYNAQTLVHIFLPYSSMKERAKYLGMYSSDGSFEDNESPAMNNTFFNLNDMGRKFKVSNQTTFSLYLIGEINGNVVSTDTPFTFEINDETGVSISTDEYGIFIKFNGSSGAVIQTIGRILFGDDRKIRSLSQINLKAQSCFSIACETDYLYQDLDRFNFESGEVIHGFMPEDATEDNVVILAPEVQDDDLVSTVFEEETYVSPESNI